MNQSRRFITRINEMKRPKDFYLHRYWRDLSDYERRLLNNKHKRMQPRWLDSTIRGDYRDWDKDCQKYQKILDREVRRQLGKLVSQYERNPSSSGGCYFYR